MQFAIAQMYSPAAIFSKKCFFVKNNSLNGPVWDITVFVLRGDHVKMAGSFSGNRIPHERDSQRYFLMK